MKFPYRATLALAGALLLAPLAAAAQSSPQPEQAPQEAGTPAPKPYSETTKDPATGEETSVEDKRICKSVRADASSRRKTRVCRTKKEWRELNIPM